MQKPGSSSEKQGSDNLFEVPEDILNMTYAGPLDSQAGFEMGEPDVPEDIAGMTFTPDFTPVEESKPLAKEISNEEIARRISMEGDPETGAPPTSTITGKAIEPMATERREWSKTEPYGEKGENIPKELAGMVARPVIDIARGINMLGGAMGESLSFGLWKGQKAADVADEALRSLKEKAKTPLTDERADLATSMLIGGGVGTAQKLLMKAVPWIQKGRMATKAAAGIAAVETSAGDYVINRLSEMYDPLIEDSNLSESAKAGIRIVGTIALGLGSAATLERRLGKALGTPGFTASINNKVAKGMTPESLMDEIVTLKKSGKDPVGYVESMAVKKDAGQAKEVMAKFKAEEVSSDVPTDIQKLRWQETAAKKGGVKVPPTTKSPDLEAVVKPKHPELEEIGNRIDDEVKQAVDMSIMARGKGRTEIADAMAKRAQAKAEEIRPIAGDKVSIIDEHIKRLAPEPIKPAWPDKPVKATIIKKGVTKVGEAMKRPGSIAGGISGATYGVETDKEGKVTGINPLKMAVGWLAGTAAGSLIKPARAGLRKGLEAYTAKIGDPIVQTARKIGNRMVTNDGLRYQLGLDRGPEMKALLRKGERASENLWDDAVEMGNAIVKIAPTSLEQKRIMQIIRGGISVSKTLTKKAEEVRKLFDGLRVKQREFDLSSYSQFDKYSRKELAELNKTAKGKGPQHKATPKELETMQEAQDKVKKYYKVGSAKSYAPNMYEAHEGLTKVQRSNVKQEIKLLRKKLRGIEDQTGKNEVSELIRDMQKLITKKTGIFKASKEKMDLGYTMQRKEMPVEVQRVLGKMDEAPYPIAKGLGIQSTDIQKASMFKEIADNPEWVIPDRKGSFKPPNFKLVEGKKYGALDGQWVRRDVWGDLDKMVDTRNAFIRHWDKWLGMWKMGKVVYNPATQARNAASNAYLAWWSGVNPVTDAGVYTKAVKALANKKSDKYYKQFKDWGLYDNTFFQAELSRMRDKMGGLRTAKGAKEVLGDIAQIPATMYQGSEAFFKTAVAIKQLQMGKTVDEACKQAEKYLFNYGDVPSILKHVKRWSSPFATFTFKALPLFAETVIRKPWKLAGTAGFLYGLEQHALKTLGVSEEEYTEEKKAMPDWQRGMFNLLMPMKDKWGNKLTLDLAYLLPFGTIGEKWGQSRLPIRDLMPSHPIFNALMRLNLNRDTFTGKEIGNKLLDSNMKYLQQHLMYAWRDAVPSLAPGGHSFNKLKTGIKNATTQADRPELDWADRPVQLTGALLDTLLGIKLRPIHKEKLAKQRRQMVRNVKYEVNGEIRMLRYKLKRNAITLKEYNQEVQELTKLQTGLLQDMFDF